MAPTPDVLDQLGWIEIDEPDVGDHVIFYPDNRYAGIDSGIVAAVDADRIVLHRADDGRYFTTLRRTRQHSIPADTGHLYRIPQGA